jgi:uracil-DNA glycosylase family 4
LLIVGLAPGLRGANRTGRPFTGDFAGEFLYGILRDFGLAMGSYSTEADDDFALIGCRVTNAVRCVPPKNRPTGVEIINCNQFLKIEIRGLKSLRAILALGTIAHGATLTALGERKSAIPFRHGEIYPLRGSLVLADSYHCSRLNTNTRRLTREMFEAVFHSLVRFL